MRKQLLLSVAVAALLAPLAGPAGAQDRVGVTSAVNQSAELERASGRRTVVIGENVLFEDRVITSRDALVQILFVDGSAFTVGSNARVVIDEFVFNPSTGSGALVAEVTEGALRFVGGQLSKSGGQVNFRTPVGTLGVRGAIVNIDLAPPCVGSACPIATASLVFGREIVVTLPNGQTRRVYRPGYSLVFSGDPNNPTVEIVPTSTLDQSSLQARLSGRPGQTGGATVIPTNADVVASGIPQVNSNLAPRFVLPRPRPTIVNTRFTPENELPGVTTVTNEINQTIVDEARGDAIDSEVANANPPPPPPPAPRAERMAVFLTPPVARADGQQIDDPGRVGIVADVTDSYDAQLIFDEDDNPVQVEAEADTFDVPGTLGRTVIAPFFSETIGELAEGVVYRGEENFLFYYLQPSRPGAAEEIVTYLAYGVPTDPSVLVGPTGSSGRPQQIRTYELVGDEQRRARGIGTQMPFLNPLVAQEFGISALAQSAETPLYLVDRTLNQRFVIAGYAGLLIEGQGREQRSAINVMQGTVEPAGNGTIGLGFNRHGSYRLAADRQSDVMRGTAEALNPLDGESPFFGSNAQNVVIGNVSSDFFFFDDSRPFQQGFLTPDELYSSTTTVANLVDQTLASDRDRPARFVSGFAAGLNEPSTGVVAALRSTSTDDFGITFDPVQSRLGGSITVRDVTGADPVLSALTLGFGSTSEDPSNFSNGRSTYVDEDTYFAVQSGIANSRAAPTTSVTLDSDAVVLQRQDQRPTIYLVGSETVPQPQLFAGAGVTPCSCDFLEWGWWGARTEINGPEVPNNFRRDYVHLGTWAAGDVTDTIDLPTTGSASYAGHAVGNVSNSGAQYVAAGNLGIDYNFGQRTGTLSISNFDGRSFSGPIAGQSGLPSGNLFSGNLSADGLAGSTSGAFVRGPSGPAQGVIGSFNVGGGSYSAAGTYVGQQTPNP